jgi:hypothetical protein
MTGSVSWCMLGPTVYDGRNTGSPKYVWNSESSHAGVLVVVSSRSTSMAHALLAGWLEHPVSMIYYWVLLAMAGFSW